jgi:ferredoxin
MAHVTSRSYYNLQKRLDEAPQGAPASETLFRILEVLFTKDEAELVSLLPGSLFTVEEAAKVWRVPVNRARSELDALADKGILLDIAAGDMQGYMLAPTMAGFFEFSLMRLDGRFDKQILSELYYQYINTEEDFIRSVLSTQPHIGRAYVQEDAIQEKDRAVVLDYERATHVIDTSSCITVGTCYCRHKMQHVGKSCDAPQEVCLTFNWCAESLARHGIARTISRKEAHKILGECIEIGLVQLGDNVQEGVNWICNCCSCCCEGLVAYRRLGYNARLTTNFVSTHNREACIGCDICIERCPVNAITQYDAGNGDGYVSVDSDRCIGCGVCARFCPTGSMVLERRKEIAFVPKDSFERYVLIAIAKGRLQNLLFDNRTLFTHDLLRRFLKVILSLKPAKRALAQRQIQSRLLKITTRTKQYALYRKLMDAGKMPDYTHPELTSAAGSESSEPVSEPDRLLPVPSRPHRPAAHRRN